MNATPDRYDEMQAHLAELRIAHEDDAIRSTLHSFIAYGDKLDSYLNWLMAATGAAVALILAQWAGVSGALGHVGGLLVVSLLMLALLIGVVARFEIYQAQIVVNLWRTLPNELGQARAHHAADVAQYLEAMRHAAGQTRLPVPEDMNRERIGEQIRRLMPPDFNTGWRYPIWRVMELVALALTGHGPTADAVGQEWVGVAVATYRVGSAMWLIVFYQVVLLMAALVGLAGLLWL